MPGAGAARSRGRRGPGASGRRPRSVISRWLASVDRQASRPRAAVLIIAAAGAWIMVSIAAGFRGRWETIFQTLVAALTLAMMFIIQHTQARQQRATQRKLDEILRAIPNTDNSLLTLEHASDDELHQAAVQHKAIRRSALDDHLTPGPGHQAPGDSPRRPC